MSSIQFSALRFIMVAPILLLITGIVERGIRIEKKDWGRLIAVSIVGVTLYQTLFMVSVKYTTATNASLLISMSPIFTGILAILYKHEAFSLKTQLGSVLAFSVLRLYCCLVTLVMRCRSLHGSEISWGL